MRSLFVTLFLSAPILFTCRTAPHDALPQEGVAPAAAQSPSAPGEVEQSGTGGASFDLSEFRKTIHYENETAPGAFIDQRIAIVGAGAAGLAAAHYLKQKGYTHITVYEKESRVGGKVYTDTIGGKPYELGAWWTGETYPTVLELANFYHAAYEHDPLTHWVESSPGKGYPFQNSYFMYGRPLLMPLALIGLEAVYLRFGKDIKKAGLDGIHPDLFMDMDSFAKKYGIKVVTDGFEPFWVGCGYNYYHETPAVYVLKLMLPNLAATLRDTFKKMSFSAWNDGIYHFPAGYSTLFDKIAAGIGDLRLGSPVTRIQRQTAGGATVIKVTAGGKTDTFDRIIVATDLRLARQFLDVSGEEKDLFGQVVSHHYNSYIIDMKHMTYPAGRVVYFGEYNTPRTAGHIVAMCNRYADRSLWNVLQIAPYSLSSQDADQLLGQDLDRLNAGTRTVVKEASWDYFPHVSTAALQAGFYDRMAALQGQKGTYYIGAVMNLETVEYTTVFAKDLVMKYF